MAQALYSVSIYDTLGPDTAVYIINHAEIKCIVCSLEVCLPSNPHALPHINTG